MDNAGRIDILMSVTGCGIVIRSITKGVLFFLFNKIKPMKIRSHTYTYPPPKDIVENKAIQYITLEVYQN